MRESPMECHKKTLRHKSKKGKGGRIQEFKEKKFIKMPVNTVDRSSTGNPHVSELKIPKTSTIENDTPDGPKTR